MKKLLVCTLMVLITAGGFIAIVAPGAANAAIVNISAKENTIDNKVNVLLDTGNTYVASGIPTPDWIGDDSWTAWLLGGPNIVSSPTPYASGLTGWLNLYFIEVDGVPERIWDGLLHPTAESAFLNMPDHIFSVISDPTVKFYIHDSHHQDNSGGVSLEVSQVPIPGALWLLGTGLIGLAGARKRFKP